MNAHLPAPLLPPPPRHRLLVILLRTFLGYPVGTQKDTLLEEVTHLTTLIQNYISRWARLMIQKRVSREALPDLLGVEVRSPKMSKFWCCKNWTAMKLHLKQTKKSRHTPWCHHSVRLCFINNFELSDTFISNLACVIMNLQIFKDFRILHKSRLPLIRNICVFFCKN